MSRSLLPAFLLAAFVLCELPAAASADKPPAVANEVIVKYKNNPSQSERANIRAQMHARSKRKFRMIDAEVVHVDDLSVEQAIAAARTSSKVEYAEPNYVLHAFENAAPAGTRAAAAPGALLAPAVPLPPAELLTPAALLPPAPAAGTPGAGVLLSPNDPYFVLMWQLKNNGQTGGTPGADIRATKAWDVFTGDPNLLVGVVDTGIDYTHPDLGQNVWTNPGEIPGNGIDDDNNGYVDDVHGYDFANGDGDPIDDNGHGTHVSGTIAARGNNGIGTVGLNWQAKIVAIKFLNAGGSGSVDGAIAAIEYAVTVGVRVMNASWGGGGFSQALEDAIAAAGAAGELFVAAAGNDYLGNNDLNPVYPASFPLPNIISVAATDNSDHLAYFSNYGPTTVDIGAPGDRILSTFPGGSYAVLSGTSMAAPHVTGTLALMLGRSPGLTASAAKALLLQHADPVPDLAGKVVSNGRLNAFLSIADADSIPPGTIVDLAATGASSNTIVLSWHATGDDGSAGRATEYDVRYAPSPITPANFGSATRVTSGVPLPDTSGSPQSFEVTGLAFSTKYYLALRAIDEFGNAGQISNVVTGTTLGAPRAVATPASFHESLLTGQSVTRTLRLENGGEGTLDFTIPDPQPVTAPQPVYPFQLIQKGTRDPRTGPAVLDHHGGPDAYGYRWTDSDDPLGPTFDWVDIIGTGTRLESLVGDEDVSVSIPIGFDFPFYGTTFNTVNIANNGWLSFTSALVPSYANQPLPNSGDLVPENLIAPFWTDFTFLGVPRVYYKHDGARFIVSFVNVPHYVFGGSYTFQVVLDPSGGIRYQYLDLVGPTQYATIGIQNAARDIGLNIAFNSLYAHGGLAVQIQPPLRWLSVTPRSGRILAGQSQDLTVRFDAGSLLGASYRANLEVDSNDPQEPVLAVPAQLDVIGVPDLTLSATSLDLGPVFVGGTARDTLVISDTGTDSLRVSSIVSDNPAFTVVPAALVLGPFESGRVHVTFSPSTLGPAKANLRITSNDPDRGSVTVALAGAGIPPPNIAVSPESLSAALLVGETAVRTLHIANTGSADLEVQLGVEGGSAPAPARAGLSRAAPGKAPSARLAASRAPVEEPPGGGGGYSPRVGPSLNAQPRQSSPRALSGVYSGTYLKFGISDLGEIMPFQYPIGNEHLQVGAFISGYTVGFLNGGAPSTYFAGYEVGNGLLPLSYAELVNTPDLVVVETVAQTVDSQLQVRRRFTFPRGQKYVHINTTLVNISGHTIAGPIFKPFADWDVDGDYQDDTWDYDPGHRMAWAANQHYVAIASAEKPDVIDVFGWPDLADYTTTVEFPNGPLQNFDGLELLHFSHPDLASGATMSVNTAYCAGDDLEELRSVVERAVPNLGWLGVDTLPFTVPAGQSRDVQVTFDARSLVGGDYSARVLVSSNDPDEPVIRIPAHLHATGVPDIRVSSTSLAFGDVFVGFSRPETLVVSNDGTDTLRVTSITSSSADYHPEVASMALGPHASRPLPVTFTPSAPVFHGGTLTLRSDDPDEGTLDVTLSGAGLLPPVAGVSPESLAVTLFTGATAHRALHVSNTGGSNLSFSVTLEGDSARAGPAAARAAATATGGTPRAPALLAARGTPPAARAMLERRAGAAGSGIADPKDGGSWAAYAARTGSMDEGRGQRPRVDAGTLPTVIQDPAGDAPAVDVVRLGAAAGFGSLRMRLDLATPFDPSNFGGFISLDIDRNPATGLPPLFGSPGQDIGAEFQILMFGVEFGVVDLERRTGEYIGSFPITSDASGFEFAIPLAALDGDDGTMDVVGVVGTNFGPTDWFPDSGHGTIYAVSFLSVVPDSGSVPPGSTGDLDAVFDAAGLNGGDYAANLRIETNDPGPGGLLQVRARLHVIGAPDLILAPAALDFGSPFAGQTAAESLVVSNGGTDLLEVTGIAVSPAVFSASDSSFSLAPGSSRVVLVFFRSLSPGKFTGALRVSSNDPDSPLATVALAGTALAAPVIGVSPESVTVALIQGQITDRTLTIANHGGSPLTFDIPQPLLSDTTARLPALVLAKGQPDPRVGPPVTQGRGGPDGFGYRWIDSRDAGGPAFGWVDLTGIGARAPLFDDEDVATNIPVGFAFPFYSDSGAAPRTFTTINIASNGWLSFTDAQIPSYTNQPLPSGSAPANLIAPFWADLDLLGVPGVYYYSDGQKFYVAWINVQHYGGGGPYTFEAILDRSGEITFQYLLMSSPTYLATVGIQNENRDIGLTIAFNVDYVANGLAVRVIPPARWLSATPAQGSVAPGGAQDVRLHLDARDLAAGSHSAELFVRSNDPIHLSITVPVRLQVVLLPDIDAAPVSFGPVYVGARATQPAGIRNAGRMPLVVGGITAAGAGFSVAAHDSLPITVAAGESTTVQVQFAPAAVCAACGGELLVTSNDPDENPFHVPLSGSAIPAPEIETGAASVEAALAPALGTVAAEGSRALTIRNSGGSDLTVAIHAVQAQGSAALPAAHALEAGGPDAFGYTWVDSDNPRGPAYDWIDIVDPAHRLPLTGNDRVLEAVPIGFEFPFYGNRFNSVNVSTNGWLSFTSYALAPNNVALPSAAEGVPENLIAPFWDNLFFGTVERAYARRDGNTLVVSWVGVLSASDGAGPYTFQVVLYPSGKMKFQYQTLGPGTTSATAGIQNDSRTDGLTVNFNQPYAHNGLAVEIVSGPSWLTVEPANLVVKPGEAADVAAHFNATGLDDGDYAAAIALSSNDVETPVVSIPATLHVGSIDAAFALDPNDLNRSSQGRWVQGQVTLPAGWDPQAIATASVRVQNAIPVATDGPISYSQQDAKYKFDRTQLLPLLLDGDAIPVKIIGEIGNRTWFSGFELIRMHRATMAGDASLYIMGARVPLSWSDAKAYPAVSYDLWYSANAGDSWSLVAGGLARHDYVWTVPLQPSDAGLLELVGFDALGAMGSWFSKQFRVVPGSAGIAPEALPGELGMRNVSANPARGPALIELALPARTSVELSVYDVRGARVRSLVVGELPAGWHRVSWDGADPSGTAVGAGIYFIRATAGGRTFVTRVALVR